MKKVCLLTEFNAPDSTYSLIIVAEEQIAMLAKAGYQPVAIAMSSFKPMRAWNEAEIRYLPDFPKHNPYKIETGWEEWVGLLEDSLELLLSDIDIVVTHDLIYQDDAFWLNVAARRVAKKMPHLKWANWVHSATPSKMWTRPPAEFPELATHFPNSKTVFPNEYSRPRIANNFKCEVDDVVFVPHSTDILTYLGVDAMTREFVGSKRLLEAEYILVYPIRLDRGKQVEYVIQTVAALKRLGKTARAVIVDFHSTGKDKNSYRDDLKALAMSLDLNEVEVAFTSEFDPVWRGNVPRNVVRDLFLLSNVFVMPSVSETYSLITQEAALCGNFLVLNFDFPPMRSIYGEQAAYYKFSSGIDALSGMDGHTKTTYEDVGAYFHDIALRLMYEMENNPVMGQKTRVRRLRNPEFVFRNYYEPLFQAWEG